MNIINMTAIVIAASVTAWTVRFVADHAVRQRQHRQHSRRIADFAQHFSTELSAGAQPVTAAQHVLECMAHQEAHWARAVETNVREIQLGTRPNRVSAPAAGVSYLLELWDVAQQHGVALGKLVKMYEQDARARQQHHNSAAAALAGARMTMILLVALPAGTLMLGESMGLRPLMILLTNPLGAVLLLGGAGMLCTGVVWAETLIWRALGGGGGRADPQNPGARDPAGRARTKFLQRRPRADPGHWEILTAARTLDLFAACLRSGLPVAPSWFIATSRGQVGDDLRITAGLARLGAGSAAWQELAQHPSYGPVARQAIMQAQSGATLTVGVENQAEHLRRRVAEQATEVSQRIMVAIAAPLTLCFLPGFVTLGLLPLIIGLAGI